MKFSPEQRMSDHPPYLNSAVGSVCPDCGSRVGKPCVSTVPMLGVGAVGTPIEGVHAARIAAAHAEGVA